MPVLANVVSKQQYGRYVTKLRFPATERGSYQMLLAYIKWMISPKGIIEYLYIYISKSEYLNTLCYPVHSLTYTISM